jgi:hypothetical protein
MRSKSWNTKYQVYKAVIHETCVRKYVQCLCISSFLWWICQCSDKRGSVLHILFSGSSSLFPCTFHSATRCLVGMSGIQVSASLALPNYPLINTFQFHFGKYNWLAILCFLLMNLLTAFLQKLCIQPFV